MNREDGDLKPGGVVPLRCSCGCTFAQLREDGALVIVSRHHGQKCINVLTLEELMKLRQEAEPHNYHRRRAG
jgi:hypothetical protein